MYPPVAAPEDPGKAQAKLLVNIVVVIFLIIGLFMVLQYFNFLFLQDMPIMGGWLMDVYEQVFGVPRILVLHGDDSIGDWRAMRNALSNEIIFISEDLDVNEIQGGILPILKKYSLIIVEDAKTINKDKLLNIDQYVEGGGNIIWVGDAGTRGIVKCTEGAKEGEVYQYGWQRDVLCFNAECETCDCKTASNKSKGCAFLADTAEKTRIKFQNRLGVSFVENMNDTLSPNIEITDKYHWAVQGLRRNFTLETDTYTKVSAGYTTHSVADIVDKGVRYPAVITNTLPSASGMVVYFAYPPEETLEILKPLVERLRY